MILDYLKLSTRVSAIYMLINSEHGLKANDLVFMYKTFHFKIKINLVLTKCDHFK
jgi:GTP-binding protein EngB required for normal cell division